MNLARIQECRVVDVVTNALRSVKHVKSQISPILTEFPVAPVYSE